MSPRELAQQAGYEQIANYITSLPPPPSQVAHQAQTPALATTYPPSDKTITPTKITQNATMEQQRQSQGVVMGPAADPTSSNGDCESQKSSSVGSISTTV